MPAKHCMNCKGNRAVWPRGVGAKWCTQRCAAEYAIRCFEFWTWNGERWLPIPEPLPEPKPEPAGPVDPEPEVVEPLATSIEYACNPGVRVDTPPFDEGR